MDTLYILTCHTYNIYNTCNTIYIYTYTVTHAIQYIHTYTHAIHTMHINNNAFNTIRYNAIQYVQTCIHISIHTTMQYKTCICTYIGHTHQHITHTLHTICTCIHTHNTYICNTIHTHAHIQHTHTCHKYNT